MSDPFQKATTTEIIRKSADKYTSNICVTDSVEKAINEGKLFYCYFENLDSDTDENTDLLIKVGANSLHIVFTLDVTGGRTEALIYEGSTVSANGTPVTIENFNRNFDGITVPLTTMFIGPTITAIGTEFVKRQAFASASGHADISSAINTGAKRIFKANTNYILRITSKADNCLLNVVATFSEPELVVV